MMTRRSYLPHIFRIFCFALGRGAEQWASRCWCIHRPERSDAHCRLCCFGSNARGKTLQDRLCNYNQLHPSFGVCHNGMQMQSSKIFDFKLVARYHTTADLLIWDVSQQTWSPGFLYTLQMIIHLLIVYRFVLTLEVIGVHNAHPSALTWGQGKVTPKKPLGWLVACKCTFSIAFPCFNTV